MSCGHMKKVFKILFPQRAENKISGVKFPVYIFTLIAIVGTIRSCIHLLSPDGGAGSIAGMDLSVSGADEVIFAFALWGSAQLIYALIQLLVAFRYKSLIPFMYLLLIAETLLRMLAGYMKPVEFSSTPPGAFGNYVILPLAALMLALMLWSSMKSDSNK